MLESIKSITQCQSLSSIAKQAYSLYFRLTNKKHHIQYTNTDREYPLIRLGTEYGGWTIIAEQNLNNSIILSAGLGEDASFDIEFANKYDSKVLIVDPTPKAINHFKNIINSLGQRKKKPYSNSGKEPIDSYDTSNINKSQLVLIEKALWDTKTTIEFYKPKKESHVSHSITNWQHGYRSDTDYIEVQADTIFSMFESQKIQKNKVNLIKLDIEGAEVEVILNMMENNFYPDQILVEFDELHKPSKKAFERVDQAHESLLKNEYKLVHIEGCDALYYHQC